MICTTCNHQDDLRRPSKEVKMQLPDDDEWNLDDDDDDDDNDDDDDGDNDDFHIKNIAPVGYCSFHQL